MRKTHREEAPAHSKDARPIRVPHFVSPKSSTASSATPSTGTLSPTSSQDKESFSVPTETFATVEASDTEATSPQASAFETFISEPTFSKEADSKEVNSEDIHPTKAIPEEGKKNAAPTLTETSESRHAKVSVPPKSNRSASPQNPSSFSDLNLQHLADLDLEQLSIEELLALEARLNELDPESVDAKSSKSEIKSENAFDDLDPFDPSDPENPLYFSDFNETLHEHPRKSARSLLQKKSRKALTQDPSHHGEAPIASEGKDAQEKAPKGFFQRLQNFIFEDVESEPDASIDGETSTNETKRKPSTEAEGKPSSDPSLNQTEEPRWTPKRWFNQLKDQFSEFHVSGNFVSEQDVISLLGGTDLSDAKSREQYEAFNQLLDQDPDAAAKLIAEALTPDKDDHEAGQTALETAEDVRAQELPQSDLGAEAASKLSASANSDTALTASHSEAADAAHLADAADASVAQVPTDATAASTKTATAAPNATVASTDTGVDSTDTAGAAPTDTAAALNATADTPDRADAEGLTTKPKAAAPIETREQDTSIPQQDLSFADAHASADDPRPSKTPLREGLLSNLNQLKNQVKKQLAPVRSGLSSSLNTLGQQLKNLSQLDEESRAQADRDFEAENQRLAQQLRALDIELRIKEQEQEEALLRQLAEAEAKETAHKNPAADSPSFSDNDPSSETQISENAASEDRDRAASSSHQRQNQKPETLTRLRQGQERTVEYPTRAKAQLNIESLAQSLSDSASAVAEAEGERTDGVETTLSRARDFLPPSVPLLNTLNIDEVADSIQANNRALNQPLDQTQIFQSGQSIQRKHPATSMMSDDAFVPSNVTSSETEPLSSKANASSGPESQEEDPFPMRNDANDASGLTLGHIFQDLKTKWPFSKRKSKAKSTSSTPFTAAFGAEAPSTEPADAPHSQPSRLASFMQSSKALIVKGLIQIEQLFLMPEKLKVSPTMNSKTVERLKLKLKIQNEAPSLLALYALIALPFGLIHLLVAGRTGLSLTLNGYLLQKLLGQFFLLALPAILITWRLALPLRRLTGKYLPTFSGISFSAITGIPLAISLLSALRIVDWSVARMGFPLKINPFLHIPIPPQSSDFFLLFLVVGVIGAFVEELFFRGVLLTGMLRSGRVYTAIALSALVYAITSFDRYFIFAFFAGLLFAWLRYTCGSIYANMLSNLLFKVTLIFLSTSVDLFRDPIPMTHSGSQAGLLASALSLLISLSILAILLYHLSAERSLQESPEFPRFTHLRSWRPYNAKLFIALIAIFIITLFLGPLF